MTDPGAVCCLHLVMVPALAGFLIATEPIPTMQVEAQREHR